jgi:hypothetical protein
MERDIIAEAALRSVEGRGPPANAELSRVLRDASFNVAAPRAAVLAALATAFDPTGVSKMKIVHRRGRGRPLCDVRELVQKMKVTNLEKQVGYNRKNKVFAAGVSRATYYRRRKSVSKLDDL